jgi:hypothetical protein
MPPERKSAGLRLRKVFSEVSGIHPQKNTANGWRFFAITAAGLKEENAVIPET